MAPTLILIRHAQALHNHNIPDPSLTELGLTKQCPALSAYLQSSLPIAQEIELIVTSPMYRTMQTAHTGLDWLIARGVPTIAMAEFQENSDKPCDTGRPLDHSSAIKSLFPEVDWSHLDAEWPSKEGLYEWSVNGIENRGLTARKWLRNRPEKVIAVVSHGGFLRLGMSNRKYNNADFRVFDFEEGTEGDEDSQFKLKEWKLTEEKGGGLGQSYKGSFTWEDSDFKTMAKEKGGRL